VISAVQLTRKFGSRIVVEDVSFEVNRGEIVALLGPNGAGKTTTLRMLAGLIAPTSGSAAIDGVRMTGSTGSLLRSRLGFLTETPGLWDRLTVRENLETYANLYGLDQAAALITQFIEHFDLLSHADTRAAELSKGMRQKVALARALLHGPAILLLDEPTAGLDPEITRNVRRLLEERRHAGCAILLSTHNLDEAERLADRIGVLHRRLVAIDKPAALRQRLMTGRVTVRLQTAAAAFLPHARAFDRRALAEENLLTLTVASESETPALVRALAAAGADILEVRREIPPLEDVYLHLVQDQPDRRSQS
jgi:ABC-2 type transport system ATP-binding protein